MQNLVLTSKRRLSDFVIFFFAKNLERIREYSWCCGAGGGVKEAYPEFSNWTASERIEEAKSTGAEAIISACGWCEKNFLDSINLSGEKLKVFDVIELVDKAI